MAPHGHTHPGMGLLTTVKRPRNTSGTNVTSLCGTGGLQCTTYNAWSMGLRR